MRILPFAAYPEPSIDYPEALELATVLLTIENRRGKGTGFILRKASEEVRWVSRVVWPMLSMPVSLPVVEEEEADGRGDHRPGRPHVLFFDLTGMTSGPMPPFQAREGLDLPPADSGRLPVGDFIDLLKQKAQALREPRRPLLGKIAGLIRRGDSGAEVEGFVSGHARLAQDLALHLPEPGSGDWMGIKLPHKLSLEEASTAAHELEERLRAYLAQADRIEELVADLVRRSEAYPAELSETRERIEAAYNAQIETLKPDVDRTIASHQQALEDKLNSVNKEYSGTLAALEAEVSRAQHEEDRFQALGREYDAQLAEARRNRQNAQRRLDQTARERDGAARQAREHFRKLIDEENERLAALIRARDREVQAIAAKEERLRAAINELTELSTAAAEKDRESAAELASLAVPVPEAGPGGCVAQAGGSGPVEFGLPLYVARLDGQRTRYLVLTPLRLRRTKSVGQFVSGLIGGLSLPAEQRSSRYEGVFGRALGAALEGTAPSDTPAATVAASLAAEGPGADLLASGEVRRLAVEGLEVLHEDGWLRGKQYEEQLEAVQRLFR